jgi:hypothetical protein
MKTTAHPPAYPGASEPEIIIGVNLLSDFKKHYKLVRYCRSHEEFSKEIAAARIPDEVREAIAAKYQLLRESGWYVRGIGEHGHLTWFYQLDSRMPAMKELGRIDKDGNNIDGVIFSKEECNLARATVHKRMERVSGRMPRCEPWDYQEHDSGR